MAKQNWITAYSRMDARPTRYERQEEEWLDLQRSLNSGGKGLSIEKLQQLGEIAKTD